MPSQELRSPDSLAVVTASATETLSILGVTNVALRNRRLVLGVIAAVFVLAVGQAALAPRQFASSASFVPAGQKAASPVSGLAAQFGIAVPGADNQQSPDFYVALLHSKTVQDSVVNARYSFVSPKGSYTGTLVDFFGDPSVSPARRRATALRALDKLVVTGTSIKTGAVSLTVRTFSPSLSADIARNLLSALDRFNRARWQTQSTREREFAEEQMSRAAADLRAAEGRLQAFQEQNREYDRAPRLTAEHERITREVGMRQQLYSTLAQSYAQARIESVRDNPSVTILESPEVAPEPEPRGLLRTGVVALLAGLFLGMLLAFLREHAARTRRLHPDEHAEYAMLRAEAARELRNPLRLLRTRTR